MLAKLLRGADECLTYIRHGGLHMLVRQKHQINCYVSFVNSVSTCSKSPATLPISSNVPSVKMFTP